MSRMDCVALDTSIIVNPKSMARVGTRGEFLPIP